MKKQLAAFLLASALLPTLAFADRISSTGVDCDTTPTDPSCVQGNGNPLLIMEPWGLTAQDSQKYWIPDGTTVVLKSGVSQTCPFWYPSGCFDLRWFYKE